MDTKGSPTMHYSCPLRGPHGKRWKLPSKKLAFVGKNQAADEGALRLNREVVLQLYDALEERDGYRVQRLVAPDLEWWFHGPPFHQHMKRLLTGEDDSFKFLIYSVDDFGSTVVAEGTDVAGSVFWAHAWTVSDGLITEVREYINTSLTVARLGVDAGKSSSSAAGYCQAVWQSRLPSFAGKSLPGLVLAI
ncbi:hypothetical protein HPP92_011685 [Vanilla planifolia]|uniref:Wound-induced protein 1 n=1 Tax=Vanilla planifolia TaxID=51239 RepID=A0A835R6H7_VANPL|nr:hypothetical protein HPP92_011685 [Vanilla planifolia]